MRRLVLNLNMVNEEFRDMEIHLIYSIICLTRILHQFYNEE